MNQFKMNSYFTNRAGIQQPVVAQNVHKEVVTMAVLLFAIGLYQQI